MSSSSTRLDTTAKGLALATSFIFSGGFTVVSLMAIPAFQHAAAASPALAASQFALIYRIGYVTQPPGTAFSALMFGLVAYRARAAGDATWGRWATGAVLAGAALPWTFGLMEPVSHGLLRIAGVEKGEEESRLGAEEWGRRTRGLLSRWNRLNMVRGVTSGVAGLLGLWAVLDG